MLCNSSLNSFICCLSQFFLGDYRPVIRDTSGGVYDQVNHLSVDSHINDMCCERYLRAWVTSA